VVDRLLLRGPEHVIDPGSLRRVYAHLVTTASGEFTTSTLPYAAYTTLRDRARSIAHAAAYNVNEGRVGRGIDAVPAQLGSATSDFFPLLGVHAARGRFFSAAEDSPPDGTPVAVLDYGYWLREFGGSDSAIGRSITINDKAYSIIGIAPRGFTGAELRRVDVWIPVSTGSHPTPTWWNAWNAQWLNVVMRVAPGLSATQVDEDLTRAFRAGYGGADKYWRAADVSARDIAFTTGGKERPEAPIARWLTAVAVLVLLIAIANVANLLVVRLMRRRQETAIRLALGISRGRLMRLIALESVAFAMLGGAAGIGVAYVGGETMRRVLLPSIAWDTSPVSGRVLLVAVMLTVLVGLAIAVAPIVHAIDTQLSASLRGGGARHAPSASRTRRLLLGAQTAISAALLVGAGLFVRSLSNVRHLDLGVEPDRVLVARVGLPAGASPTPAAAAQEKAREANVWRELRDRIAHTPGVMHASLAIGSPFGNGFGVDVTIPGRVALPVAPGGGPYISAVSAEYFATTGTRILRGRAFDASDGAQSPRVAIVNETMASLVWPNEDAIGKCIIVNNTSCATVVGVAHDARRFGIREPPSMQYYIAFGQETGFGGTVLLVRPTGDAKAFEQTLRRAIIDAIPDVKLVNVSSMQDRVDPQVRPWRLGAMMFGLFAAIALVVAAVGMYSTIAYSTAQRTHEFGVRLAIGSSSGRLMRTVVYEAIRLTLVGLACGIIVALIGGARVAPLLFDVSPRDPVVFSVVVAVLFAVAIVASLVPALRAARTDPVVALRSL
jgi:predicted permease